MSRLFYQPRRGYGRFDAPPRAFELEDDSAEHLIVGQDTRWQVPGNQIWKPPYRYICNLEYDFGSAGPRALGTGTLIGPQIVLTAAHVFRSARGEPMIPDLMRVIPQRYGMHAPLGSRLARNFFSIPLMGSDIGVILLRQAFDNRVGFWSIDYSNSSRDPIGTSISISPLVSPSTTLHFKSAGYPLDLPKDRPYRLLGCGAGQACVPSSFDNPRRSLVCGTYQYLTSARTSVLRSRFESNIVYFMGDACLGQSGSPVWVSRHPQMGGRVLIGVLVRQNPAISANVVELITGDILREVRAFITATRVIRANTE